MYAPAILHVAKRLSMAMLCCLIFGAAAPAWAVVTISISPADGTNVTPGERVNYTVAVSGSVAGLKKITVTGLDGGVVSAPGTGDFPASPPTLSHTITGALAYVDIPANQAAGSAQLLSVVVEDYVDGIINGSRNVNVQATGGGGGGSLIPLVDLNASTLTLGSMTTWANHGSLGGVFNSITEFQFTGNPVVEEVSGRRAATFNSNGMRATVSPPASITGSTPNITVVFQSYNPNFTDGAAADGIEVSLEWGMRANSQWAGFGIGNNDWGAASFFGGGRNFGYGPAPYPTALAPSTGAWHVSVITINGTTAQATAYIDKVQTNQAPIGGTPPFGIVGIPFIMGGTSDLTTNRNVTASFARVQVYDTVLDATQVAALTDELNAPSGPPPPNAVDDWMIYN